MTARPPLRFTWREGKMPVVVRCGPFPKAFAWLHGAENLTIQADGRTAEEAMAGLRAAARSCGLVL